MREYICGSTASRVWRATSGRDAGFAAEGAFCADHRGSDVSVFNGHLSRIEVGPPPGADPAVDRIHERARDPQVEKFHDRTRVSLLQHHLLERLARDGRVVEWLGDCATQTGLGSRQMRFANPNGPGRGHPRTQSAVGNTRPSDDIDRSSVLRP